MKKLLFPIASFIVGLICAIAITGHQTPARIPDKVNELVIVNGQDRVAGILSVRTSNNSDQDVTSLAQHSMKTEVSFTDSDAIAKDP